MSKNSDITPQQLATVLRKVELERSTLAAKVNELRQEMFEYNLVLDAFKAVEPTRRCYRLVGSVLVERTVEEVKPPVEKNFNMMSEYIKKLEEELEKKTKEVALLSTHLRQQNAARK